MYFVSCHGGGRLTDVHVYVVCVQLLDEPDWDIYYWATGHRTPPERWAHSTLLEKLQEHARNDGKVVRRMPDLS